MNLSRSERYNVGKVLRTKVPRESHADCPSASKRDAVAILDEADRNRIPALLRIRYDRMTKSPFTFLRGAAAVMAQDLAELPKIGAPVQACGDCHMMNFGAFPAEGRILFDINDFDETLPGVDFTVDLKRLSASLAVAARDAEISDKEAASLARATAKSYRQFIFELATMTPLEVWYMRMDLIREFKRILDGKLRDNIFAILVKAKEDLIADDSFPHLATTKAGVVSIADRPPLIYHLEEAYKKQSAYADSAFFSTYPASLVPEWRALLERYTLRDIATKVVGISSIGTTCAIGLFMTPDGEPLFLQAKEAQASVLERIVPPPGSVRHQGLRVVQDSAQCRQRATFFLAGPKTQRIAATFMSAS